MKSFNWWMRSTEALKYRKHQANGHTYTDTQIAHKTLYYLIKLHMKLYHHLKSRLAEPTTDHKQVVKRGTAAGRGMAQLSPAPDHGPNLLSILDDRIERLNRHGRFEECADVERARVLLFPERETS
jgi:hypothetical protein